MKDFSHTYYHSLKLFIFLIILFYYSSEIVAQKVYPQDYFSKPLDIPIVLSGTFGELRTNHFHSGIDIKTQRKEGLNVYACAEGYVSRIKVSHYGFGKAIYITHPNGYTTVYAHLKKFSKTLESYIKECQYEKESFEIEVFPAVDELVVSKNEIIAYSGNTGSSDGPHLHFEIRDNEERPLNPMLFGITAKDSKKPNIMGLFAYTKNDSSVVNGKTRRIPLRLIPKANGDFDVEKINANGTIGFGVVSHDQLDYAPNKNGVNNIQTFFNGNKTFEIDFKRFSFDESKHINRYVDYEYYKSKKDRIQKLFIEKNNPLSLYKEVNDNGLIKIEDSTDSVFRIRISDFADNEAWVNIPISGKTQEAPTQKTQSLSNQTLIYADEYNSLSSGKYTVNLYKNTLYENAFINFNTTNDTLHLGKDIIPLQKNIYINYNLNHYKTNDKDQLFIARLYGYKKKPRYISTQRKGDTLTAKTKRLGTYTVTKDTIPPKITPLNFKHNKWMSKYRYLKIKIEDDLSGISKFRATVNGQWILMEYDYKTKTLTHDFNDNIVKHTTNELKIIVTDNVENNSTFEATFFRK